MDSSKALVIDPPQQAGGVKSAIAWSLERYDKAAPAQQKKAWNAAYSAALAQAAEGSQPTLPGGDCGPVPQLMGGILKLAQTGHRSR